MPTIGKDIAFFAPFVAYHAVDRKALTFFRDRLLRSKYARIRSSARGSNCAYSILYTVIRLADDGGFGLASELTWRI